jgi:hypothetical protein
VSNLIAEILLRLIKPAIALILAAVIYVFATAMGEPGSVTLFLVAWLSAAAFILLVQEGPL